LHHKANVRSKIRSLGPNVSEGKKKELTFICLAQRASGRLHVGMYNINVTANFYPLNCYYHTGNGKALRLILHTRNAFQFCSGFLHPSPLPKRHFHALEIHCALTVSLEKPCVNVYKLNAMNHCTEYEIADLHSARYYFGCLPLRPAQRNRQFGLLPRRRLKE